MKMDFNNIFYQLMPLTKALYLQTSKIGWLLLFTFFLLALTFTYFKSPQGSPDFLDVVKRLVIAMFLMVSFPLISYYIQDVSQGMTGSISSISGFGAFFEMLVDRLDGMLKKGWSAPIFFLDDFIISALTFLSYMLVYLSRFLMLALYQFYWALLTVLAPILIAFYVFQKTAQVTGNLYRSLIEVSLWPFLWEIMGMMLKSLWAGEAMAVEGNYLTVILLNLIIAIAMILTPYLVHSLLASGLSSTASTIGGVATAAVLTAHTKYAQGAKIAKSGNHIFKSSGDVIVRRGHIMLSNSKDYLIWMKNKISKPTPPPPPEK